MYIYPMVRFCTNNIITVEHLRIGPQGCALAEPSGPWRLTFALWATRKSYFLHTNHMLGTLDFTVSDLWAPFNFP